jgi:hypothetical protein
MSGSACVVDTHRLRPRPSADSASSLRTNIGAGCAYLAFALSFALTGAIALGVIH